MSKRKKEETAACRLYQLGEMIVECLPILMKECDISFRPLRDGSKYDRIYNLFSILPVAEWAWEPDWPSNIHMVLESPMLLPAGSTCRELISTQLIGNFAQWHYFVNWRILQLLTPTEKKSWRVGYPEDATIQIFTWAAHLAVHRHEIMTIIEATEKVTVTLIATVWRKRAQLYHATTALQTCPACQTYSGQGEELVDHMKQCMDALVTQTRSMASSLDDARLA